MTVKGATMWDAIKVPESPFPGLRPFKFAESNLFFGRDGQIGKLISKLAATRFLAVVGTSGSGKSSLVQAGLLPALRGGVMGSAGSKWRFAILRPANDPIGALAEALNAPGVFGSQYSENNAIQTEVAKATLRRGSRGLVEVVRQNAFPANENLLVLVDQFEELFRFAREASRKSTEESDAYQNDAAAFVKLLLEAVSQREANIYVLLTMRSDFLGDCSQFWNLPETINDSQYLIPRLQRDELREVITGPATLGGREIKPRLVTQLLNDIGDNQDQLPVLQHLLMRMWDECKELRLDIPLVAPEISAATPETGSGLLDNENEEKPVEDTPKTRHRDVHEGNAIDLCCYRAVGGMAKALSQHADEAFQGLPDDHFRILAQKLFKALTEKGLDNREIRRPITFAELCEITNADPKDVTTIIDTFREPGRSFLMPPADVSLKPTSLIDISHESLIRGWVRLKKWVEQEARSSRTYVRLAETAVLQSRGEEAPLSSPALEIMLDWKKQNSPTLQWARRYHPEFEKAMAFLSFSVKKDEEKKDADKKQLEIQLAQQREVAEQQRKIAEQQTELAQVQADSATRRKRYLVILVILGFLSLGSLGYGYKSQVDQVKSKQTQLNTEIELKDKAVKAEALARAAEAKAQSALDTAAQERDRANELAGNLQIELKARNDALAAVERAQRKNKEQATTYGYYKNALDDISNGDVDSAIARLEQALEYFEGKNDVANIISTRINMGDIKSTVPDEFDYDAAVGDYEDAIRLIKKSNAPDDLLVRTLRKAAARGEDSDSSEEREASANYYEQASDVYHHLKRPGEEANALVSVGKIFSKFSDNASVESARDAFKRAIGVYANSASDRARVNLEVGEHYESLLTQPDEDDEESGQSVPLAGSSTADEQQVKESRSPAPSRIEENELRLRRTAHSYFIEASKIYNNLDEEKSAQALVRAGRVLGAARPTGAKNDAANDFVSAAQKYAKLAKLQEQSDTLTLAGQIYQYARVKDLYPKADEYYDAAVKILHDAGMSAAEARALTTLGRSYGSSEDVEQKRKAIPRYLAAADAYKLLKNKRLETDSYLKAAAILQNISGETDRHEAENLYNRAIEVYKDDVTLQIKTLITIGISLSRTKSEPTHSESEKYFGRALDLARNGGNRAVGSAYFELGIQYSTIRDLQLAMSNFETALAKYEEANDVVGQGLTLYRLSITANQISRRRSEAQGFAERSLSLLMQELPRVDASADKKTAADVYYALGMINRRKKELPTALKYLERALGIYQAIPSESGRVPVIRTTIKRVQDELHRTSDQRR